jgi:hypothetical protein
LCENAAARKIDRTNLSSDRNFSNDNFSARSILSRSDKAILLVFERAGFLHRLDPFETMRWRTAPPAVKWHQESGIRSTPAQPGGFIGGIREFEHRYGEGAVLRRAQRWAIALIGGQLGDMTDGHDLIYRRSPQEAAARRKRIYGSARYRPRQPGEMTWVEYR